MYKMNVLVIGCGGREHAIMKKLAQSNIQSKLFYVGNYSNPGMSSLGTYLGKGLMSEMKGMDLVVVGPEKYLKDGVADKCRKRGIKCIGPTSKLAKIEWSKSFARDLMRKYKVKGLVDYQIIHTSDPNWLKTVIRFVDKHHEFVIKDDGLRGGKGVSVFGDHFTTSTEALSIMKKLDTFVLEEKMVGQEFSLMSLSDGKTMRHMPLVQDYKRLLCNDKGPNTGGMGAVSYPNHLLPGITKMDVVEARMINEKMMECLQKECNDKYVGILYGGFMKTENGIKVIEFNSRFGDPEVINLMELLETDLLEIFFKMSEGKLHEMDIEYKNVATVCQYMVPMGYPIDPVRDFEIEVSSPEKVIMASLTSRKGKYIGLGSRTLALVSSGENLSIAKSGLDQSIVKGPVFCRRDIGNIDYKNAGVDIDKNELIVSRLKQFLPIGNFGGIYQLGDKQLISSIDGVGTKTIVASITGRYENLGKDIVNHCVNDILVQGGTPLFFLDYIASDNISPDRVVSVVSSMNEACREAGCLLIGGETAEMPDVYHKNGLDIVGCIIGITDNPEMNIQEGNIIIGITSNGLHTNGFSLVRRLFDRNELVQYADLLMQPHKSYLSHVRQLSSANVEIKGMCHITGGGFKENVPRVLPENLVAKINYDWTVPEIFQIIQEKGVDTEEMYRVFNMGIGYLLFIDKEDKEMVLSLLEDAVEIGEVIKKT